MTKTLIHVGFATLRMTTPLVLAALGGVFSQQVGLLNIALEGMMLMGAFAAVVVAAAVGSSVVGVGAAALVGLLTALVFAFFVIHLRADLIVAGLAVNILALGLTAYLLQVLFNTRGAYAPKDLEGLGSLTIPLLDQVPLLGPMLSGHKWLVYVTWLLVFLSWLVLYRTPLGIHIRAVGEHREAAETAGLPVKRIQYLALLTSGFLSGLAGAQLSLGNLTLFSENMSNGRGFMALAAVFFGQARPLPTALACLLFGVFEAVQIRLQMTVQIPNQLPQMLPYLIIVVVLTVLSLRERRLSAR